MAAPFQQGRTAYQDFRARLSPTALRNPVGAAFEAAFGSLEDQALDQVAQSVKARMPGVAAADALQWTGTDRLIDRGPTETDAAYASRLQGAWETWPWAGTARGILRALSDAGYPNTALVQQLGGFYTLDGGGTNLLLWSNGFSNTAWSKTHLSATANATTAPDGTVTATKLVEDAAATVEHYVEQAIAIGSGLQGAEAVYAKAAERSWLYLSFVFRDNVTVGGAFFDLTNGVVGQVNAGVTATITSAGSGWYKCAISSTVGSGGSSPRTRIKVTTGNGVATHTGDGTSGVYLWDAQAEQAVAVGPYVQTYGTAYVTVGLGNIAIEPSPRFLFDDKTPATAPAQWTPSTSFAAGKLVVPNPANGFFYGTTNPITTGSSQPTWPTTPGVTVVDGNGTWSCRGRDFWSRFAVLFTPPFPSSWGGTPPDQFSDEVTRIRRVVQLWKPAHATQFGLIALPAQLWDWPNPSATTWDTWRPTWDSSTTPAPTYWAGPVTNLCPGSSFEIDSNTDGTADSWTRYDNQAVAALSLVAGIERSQAQRVSWAVNNTGVKGVFLSGGAVDGVQGGWKPFQTYVVSFYARASGTNVGQLMLGPNWNTFPTQTTLLNPALTASWQRYAFRITWGAAVETSPVGGLYLSIAFNSGTQGTLDFDAVQVEPGDTLHNYGPT